MPGSQAKALVVRGGWEGHEPVETTDRMIPALAQVGFQVEVSNSLRDLYGCRRDERRRPHRSVLDNGGNQPGGAKWPPLGGLGRHRPGWLARWVVRRFPKRHGVPVHDRGPMGGSSGGQSRIRGEFCQRRGQRPDNRGAKGFSSPLRAVLHARRPLEHSAGDNDL